MPAGRGFHAEIQERAKVDAEFRRSLLRESVEALLNSEFEVGSRLIKDYAAAAPGVEEIAEALEMEEEGVAWLFDSDANAGGAQLLAVICAMLKREGLSLVIRRELGQFRRRLS